ncbi:E3 ubiquitin-protein ligase RNF4-like [Cyanistes caeruleus]|uniref:E3 ubiquitin-protein ligase RNF4-like n=1 Tax=Cyanistes caeruleus TaxID=156563 RepID=UPI000CDABBD5|nr:E3 ubiquitin-protein ligase RNF4-like [Cyanistes caeruleus]
MLSLLVMMMNLLCAEPGIVIKCPICMDFYSEIGQSARELVSIVFCSACLPAALDTTSMCPTCRAECNPEMYFPVYLGVLLFLRSQMDPGE